MCSMHVERLMGTPSGNLPSLIHHCWRRKKQARMMGKQTGRKAENVFKRTGFRSGMENTNIESLCCTPKANVMLYVKDASETESEVEN